MKITPRMLLLAVLALAAVVIIAINRFGGTSAPPGSTAGQQQSVDMPATSTTTAAGQAPAAGTSSTPAPSQPVDEHGDGAEDDEPPVMITPTDRPDVKESATAFAAAWLNTFRASPDTWRAGLLDRVTGELGADLADADPASVPAGGRVGNPVKVTAQGALLNAEVPVVTAGTTKPQPIGTLLLTLVDTDGAWLVSEIDWKDKP